MTEPRHARLRMGEFDHDEPAEAPECTCAGLVVERLDGTDLHLADCPARPAVAERPHIVDGEFQSDKYPTCPRGKVPLSTKDKSAQPLLWAYAQVHRAKDAQFSDDLEWALRKHGYEPPAMGKGKRHPDVVPEVLAMVAMDLARRVRDSVLVQNAAPPAAFIASTIENLVDVLREQWRALEEIRTLLSAEKS